MCVCVSHIQTLNEYIKDTEDLVNIKLDQHRNQLITTDLILTAFTASMAIITTVAGIFGMNLWSGLEDVSVCVCVCVCVSLCLCRAYVHTWQAHVAGHSLCSRRRV